MTSYYDILEVNKNASETEIKKAFLKEFKNFNFIFISPTFIYFKNIENKNSKI